MKCPSCQTINPDVAKFCMNCGARLASEKISGENTQFNLDRYLPQELVSKLESARARNEMVGERRIVTMLFCDVKGSTAAAEKVDPEVWTDIMNGVFEHMIRPIYKYEGTVPRLMGDAILAFFGAPITHEDDPQRAVLAGLEIQEGIKPYVDEIRRKYGLEFGLRVGINTGLVVAGEIGSDLRMEYTALGDAINLAARMEQTAQVGTIQISDETYKLVAPFFEVQSLGGVEVKGKSEPVQTYRVMGVKSTPGQLRGLAGMHSRLVGRDKQLDLLSHRLRRLEKGAGSFVAVIGEAGLGKSTLIVELTRTHEDARCQWLRGESLSYTRSISYFPWKQILRQSINARDTDSPAEVRGKLRYKCECCAVPGGDIPFLEAILAIEDEGSARVVSDVQGDALIQKMVDATRGYLCGIAMESPLVIVFDDLHWADEASMNLLLSLADLTETHPMYFICMLRPDRKAASWDIIQNIEQKLAGRFDPIELEPLKAEQSDAILNNLLGMKGLPKNIRNLIIEKSDGNPFFIEELIRSLVETGQIVNENGHWKAASDEARITLPNTLRGVLGARIDRLPDASKHVLQNAAVIGRQFDLRILRRLTGLNSGLDLHIQYLQDVSLIESLLEEFSFRHVLIQEATYESILIKKRAELHRQIGEMLEEVHSDRVEEFAPLLANHFYIAGDDRSMKYDIIAGEKSARLYANTEAATHFSRALEVAKHMDAGNDPLTSIYVPLGQVYELSGQYNLALETYKDMQSISLERGDRSMELKSLMALATLYSTLTPIHDPELGETILKQALVLANQLGDIPAQAKLNWSLMLNYLFSGRLPEALEYSKPTIELAQQVGDPDQLAFTLNDAGRVYQGVGAYEKAFEVFEKANELWKQQGNQVMLADNFGAAAMAHYFAGNYDRALALADQAWEISKETDNYWGQSYSRVIPTFIYIDRGLPDLVVRFGTECIETGEKGGLIASIVLIPVELAWIHGLYGETRQGIEMAERALENAVEKMPDWKSSALAVLIRLHLLAGNLGAAERIASSEQLNPIMAVIRSRYLAIVGLTNIELELARNNFQSALLLSDNLLEDMTPLGWIHNPEILYRKADALIGLSRHDEALQTLTEARSFAEKLDAKHHLWTILSSLSHVSSLLGKHQEADMYRKQARGIVEIIAESLAKIDLKDEFLKQHRVMKLM